MTADVHTLGSNRKFILYIDIGGLGEAAMMKKTKTVKKANRNSIAQKIIQAIISISLLNSIIIGAAGIIGIALVSRISQQVYSDNVKRSMPLYKISEDFSSARLDTRQLMLTQDTSGIEADIDTKLGDLQKQLKEYGRYVTSGQEKANYLKINNLISQYYTWKDNFVNAVNSGDTAKATSMMTGTISKQLADAITDGFNQNANQAGQRSFVANVLTVCTSAVIIATIGVFMALAVRKGRKTAKTISGPVEEAARAADSIACGNFEIHFQTNACDEIETLANAFNKITDSLRKMQSDVNRLVDSALEGQLDERADSGRHEGDYRKIVEGVNKMLDAVKAPLDVAFGFINRLADGEHQEDLHNTYKGYYAALIDNLNKVRKSINVLVDEMTKLALYGQNGELDKRGDDTLVKGSYALIIREVNELLDAVKQPLDTASGFVSRLADGVHQDDMDNVYKGSYGVLVANLNRVRRSISILVGESTRLAEAGIEGALDVRGDESALKGVYAEIIRKINETFDVITAPLNESNIVLGKMADNDYTAKMSDGYKGILKEFAGSINNVRDRLLLIEKTIIEVSQGDIGSLEMVRNMGKRSDNDHMLPSFLAMMQTIHDLIEQADMLADASIEGDLGKRGDEARFDGGYREIISGMNRTLEAIAAPIAESSQVLREFAKGNLTVSMQGEYKGEYNSIKASLNAAITAFYALIGDINIAADQVAAGSRQVSDASQSLSQGAAEQASSVEELQASIISIAEQTKKNAAGASAASTLALTAQEKAGLGNGKMDEMTMAMQKIDESSASISKIIKVIDDIAFQTNILALNAAVEAARAGQYGKGFAVVAEEVRNLAAKSAQAAKETTALIENSMTRVQSGTKIAKETAEMLNLISESIKKSAGLVGEIASASNSQANAITEIDRGISQVSSVVQTNSATSEESAASSEELSGQAETLKQMVGRFIINNSNSGGGALDVGQAVPGGLLTTAGKAGGYGKY